MKETKKVAFFISPIGSPGSKERKRSDDVKETFLKPILEQFDYQCIRADEISQPGRIEIQVIQRLIDSNLVIADLSDQNANVFYELAVRHAIQKPVILLIEEGQNIPFDVRTHRTINYDVSSGPKFSQAQQELRRQIEAVESDKFIVDSPIKEVILHRESPTDKDTINEVLSIVRTSSSILNELFYFIKNKEKSESDKEPFLEPFRLIQRPNAPHEYLILGKNITAGEEVDIYLDKIYKECLLDTYIANSDGTWHGVLKVPENINFGEHYIWMKNRNTGNADKIKINIE